MSESPATTASADYGLKVGALSTPEVFAQSVGALAPTIGAAGQVPGSGVSPVILRRG